MKLSNIATFLAPLLVIFVLISSPLAVSAEDSTLLDVSIVDYALRINSCSAQLHSFMGYKGFVDDVEVFATGLSGGFPCYGGDLFISDLRSFPGVDLSRPFHLHFDFYTSVSFAPPAYAYFDVYYDGSEFSLEPSPAGHPSVLFLPGFEASKLYKQDVFNCSINCEDQLWEPNLNSDVRALFMNQDGKSLDDGIYTRDVMSEAYSIANIYKSFLDKLEEMKSVDHSIADYSAVPYDWRLSYDDILDSGKKIPDGISYLEATSSPYIIQELKRLADNTQTDKITIVAHSNGGLLAKALLKRLEDTGNPLLQKIDKLILVAVPQLGTPQAIAGLLHGYNQEIPASFAPLFFADQTARELGQNMIPAYNFLPSENYFTYVDTPVVTFDSSLPSWLNHYGWDTIHSEVRLQTFLSDTFGKVDVSSADTDSPVSLRENLLSEAQSVHDILDNWTIPAEIEVIEIAGWGIPSTVSGIKYTEGTLSLIKPEPTFTIDGDGTVVTPSALWGNGGDVTRYWVDLGQYNKDKLIISIPVIGNVFILDHKNILEVSELLDLIEEYLTSTSSPSILPQYLSASTPVRDIGNNDRLIYALHSPLTLDMYDNLSRHTGISTTTGMIEEQIPGTYFLQFGESKYIFTDAGTPNRIFMDGYANGTFTFNIQELEGDTLIASTTFKDIPTTSYTKVTLDIQDDINTVSPMLVDLDGDGDTDYDLEPKLNGVVTVPTYIFSGFSQPINDTNYYPELKQSVFKSGSTIPVKFQLRNYLGTIIQADALPIWAEPKRLSSISASVDESVYSVTATTGNTYRWDSENQQYIYNWKTKGFLAGYLYEISAQLDDGYTYSVTVGLK